MIAAYRDQHKITTDDPRQVLGPYAEPGHAGHRAYWHAAESVLAARRLAGLDPADGTSSADDQARAQIAADIYRGLPDTSARPSPPQSPQTPGIALARRPRHARRARRHPARLRGRADRRARQARARHAHGCPGSRQQGRLGRAGRSRFRAAQATLGPAASTQQDSRT